jgi:probable HAF family extracellular repeat protein
MQGLGDVAGGAFNSQAYAVSADGNVVVGHSAIVNNDEAPFRWTAATGIVGLNNPTGSVQTFASSVSNDSNTIGGYAYFNAPSFHSSAAIWDAAHGTRLMQDALATDYGLTLPGWTLTSVFAISDDGRTIIGNGTNPAGKTEGWIATVPEPSAVWQLCCAVLGVLLITAERSRANGVGH